VPLNRKRKVNISTIAVCWLFFFPDGCLMIRIQERRNKKKRATPFRYLQLSIVYSSSLSTS